ncbi:hypothetical protein GWI33_017075 [Rhynchophorus ferrugineus]|uniref:Uncharacterized protein n=1 Tax=Rhynchophorus ferrugineus TaxID=354439 RepID=A0A834HYU5_RHYFE|nr:hypothetical protein GWI33_017075 [Rhynchophorus ferrugineus]
MRLRFFKGNYGDPVTLKARLGVLWTTHRLNSRQSRAGLGLAWRTRLLFETFSSSGWRPYRHMNEKQMKRLETFSGGNWSFFPSRNFLLRQRDFKVKHCAGRVGK